MEVEQIVMMALQFNTGLVKVNMIDNHNKKTLNPGSKNKKHRSMGSNTTTISDAFDSRTVKGCSGSSNDGIDLLKTNNITVDAFDSRTVKDISESSELFKTNNMSILNDHMEHEDDEKCVICYTEELEELRTTPCGHLFCVACLKQLFKIRSENCPYCVQPVFEWISAQQQIKFGLAYDDEVYDYSPKMPTYASVMRNRSSQIPTLNTPKLQYPNYQYKARKPQINTPKLQIPSFRMSQIVIPPVPTLQGAIIQPASPPIRNNSSTLHMPYVPTAQVNRPSTDQGIQKEQEIQKEQGIEKLQVPKLQGHKMNKDPKQQQLYPQMEKKQLWSSIPGMPIQMQRFPKPKTQKTNVTKSYSNILPRNPYNIKVKPLRNVLGMPLTTTPYEILYASKK